MPSTVYSLLRQNELLKREIRLCFPSVQNLFCYLFLLGINVKLLPQPTRPHLIWTSLALCCHLTTHHCLYPSCSGLLLVVDTVSMIPPPVLRWLFPPLRISFCTNVLDLLSSFRSPHKFALSERPSLKEFLPLLVIVCLFT